MRSRASTWVAGALLALALGCRASGPAVVPLPFELALEFEGQESVGADDLERIVRRELARLEVSAPDKSAVDDAAFALELFYRARGYADVRVDYNYEPDPPRARFTIHEGPRVRVREFTIDGPAEMSPALVRDAFEPMASGGAFDGQRLAAGLDKVRNLYRSHGYLRVDIDPPELTFDEDHTKVTVRLGLREGPRFFVKTLEVRGGVPELAEHEQSFARQYTSKVYLPSLLPVFEHTVGEAYLRHGYPDVQVRAQPALDEASGDVRITVTVTPGERVRIAHFRMVGNERTRDSAMLDLLGIEYGALYDSELLRKAFHQLYKTGLFDSVDLRLEGTGPERTLVVEVHEVRSVQIRVEPGWGSYEGPRVLAGIEENNFQGLGQTLALEGTVSLRAQNVNISWTDRDFLGSTLTSETTFFAEKRQEPSFDFARRGFSFFLRRDWTQEWNSSVGYEFRPTDVTDETIPSLPQDIGSDSQVAAVSVALTLNGRDNPLVPTHGSQAHARLEWADDTFGSDTEFLRAQLEYTRLVPIGDDDVLAAAARTGVIAPFGKTTDIPLPERFFNGGENSVRSFREDELLPPGASGDPAGGEAATTFNLEWRRALTGNLSGALFVDYGNVAFQVQDYLDFSGFRTGVGAGLRYLLPIGPMRLDLGVNPAPKDEEDEFVLHFSVGFPF